MTLRGEEIVLSLPEEGREGGGGGGGLPLNLTRITVRNFKRYRFIQSNFVNVPQLSLPIRDTD